MPLTIAIDGPVGAGKSSISDQVARKLGILHLDTGAMYRAVGLYCLENGVDLSEVDVQYQNGAQHTLLNGRDVTAFIRSQEVGQAASSVSRYPKVRKMLVQRQQELAQSQPMLLDGRDIGTVVLPHATVKIYLTASAQARATRRMLQLREKGDQTPFEAILEEVNARDWQDTHREADPLRRAEDAILVDSSDLSFDETVNAILAIVEAKQ